MEILAARSVLEHAILGNTTIETKHEIQNREKQAIWFKESVMLPTGSGILNMPSVPETTSGKEQFHNQLKQRKNGAHHELPTQMTARTINKVGPSARIAAKNPFTGTPQEGTKARKSSKNQRKS